MTGYVLKPETTKRNGRNENTDIIETTETSTALISVTLLSQPELAPRFATGLLRWMSTSKSSTKTSRKKVYIFHSWNGILAKTRNFVFLKKVSWCYREFVGGGERSFRERLCSILRANRDFLLSLENEGDLTCFYHSGVRDSSSSQRNFLGA